MITIHHMRHDIDAGLAVDLRVPYGRAEDEYLAVVAEAFRGGRCYEKVCTVDGDDLEWAFAATQNGVMSDSWSRLPPEGVRVEEGKEVCEVRGAVYGRKSSEMGDVFEIGGRFYVVAILGFTELPKERLEA